jgi:hypothetical protein
MAKLGFRLITVGPSRVIPSIHAVHSGGHGTDQTSGEIIGRCNHADCRRMTQSVLWADPLRPGGARPYDAYWSDGTFDWGIVAGTKTPEQAVAIAAPLYCR